MCSSILRMSYINQFLLVSYYKTDALLSRLVSLTFKSDWDESAARNLFSKLIIFWCVKKIQLIGLYAETFLKGYNFTLF